MSREFDDVLRKAVSALSQTPGSTYTVVWEDEDGIHYGIPSQLQIEMPSHKRIAEIGLYISK